MSIYDCRILEILTASTGVIMGKSHMRYGSYPWFLKIVFYLSPAPTIHLCVRLPFRFILRLLVDDMSTTAKGWGLRTRKHLRRFHTWYVLTRSRLSRTYETYLVDAHALVPHTYELCAGSCGERHVDDPTDLYTSSPSQTRGF